MIANIRDLEDQALSPLIPFDKEKLSSMQNRVLEGMTQHGNSQQCVSHSQINIPKGPVKRQVAEAWKKMKSKEGVGSKTLGSQDQCHCCKHYGFPCLRNKSTKREVKLNPGCEAIMDKKRKVNSLEP